VVNFEDQPPTRDVQKWDVVIGQEIPRAEDCLNGEIGKPNFVVVRLSNKDLL